MNESVAGVGGAGDGLVGGRGRWLRSGGYCVLEFEQVVHCADQAPFAVRSSVSAKSEFAEPQVGFDVAENGLDTDAAFAVERGVLGLRKLVIHHISGDRGIN